MNVQEFINIGSKYPIGVTIQENLNETTSNFNDMGIMQAIDNITAVYAVIEILKDNQLTFNASKTVIYGHSHGAYLGYLCNALIPSFFTLLIDNSSWLFPVYLKCPRYLYKSAGQMQINIEFNYLAQRLPKDEEFLYLPNLYRKFKNHCHIVTFHGTTDNLITHHEKKKFCNSINNCVYREISQKDVAGQIFKSTNHGLDADFLKMFDYVISNHEFRSKEFEEHYDHIFETKDFQYKVLSSYGIPIFLRLAKEKI